MTAPEPEDRLTQIECSEIVALSQAYRSMTRLGRMLGVTPSTIDRLVCWRRKGRPTTIARVRRALAMRRVLVVDVTGVH